MATALWSAWWVHRADERWILALQGAPVVGQFQLGDVKRAVAHHGFEQVRRDRHAVEAGGGAVVGGAAVEQGPGAVVVTKTNFEPKGRHRVCHSGGVLSLLALSVTVRELLLPRSLARPPTSSALTPTRSARQEYSARTCQLPPRELAPPKLPGAVLSVLCAG
jgi:hypothetical protein